jgi:hypothetical protein
MGRYGRLVSRHKEGIQEAMSILACTAFGWSNFSFLPEKHSLEMEGVGVVHYGNCAEFGGEDYKLRCRSSKVTGVRYQVTGMPGRDQQVLQAVMLEHQGQQREVPSPGHAGV